MTNAEEFLVEIKDVLKYAIKHKEWSEVISVVEIINEELDIDEKLDYVSSRDEETTEDDND